jgi:hypothetical protein
MSRFRENTISVLASAQQRHENVLSHRARHVKTAGASLDMACVDLTTPPRSASGSAVRSRAAAGDGGGRLRAVMSLIASSSSSDSDGGDDDVVDLTQTEARAVPPPRAAVEAVPLPLPLPLYSSHNAPVCGDGGRGGREVLVEEEEELVSLRRGVRVREEGRRHRRSLSCSRDGSDDSDDVIAVDAPLGVRGSCVPGAAAAGPSSSSTAAAGAARLRASPSPHRFSSAMRYATL